MRCGNIPCMMPPPRHEVILRLNLTLTFAEGVWVFWHYLRMPSETSSAVFLEYSPARLFLLLLVLSILAGNLYLLVQAFRPEGSRHGAVRVMWTVLDKVETFWGLFILFILICMFVFTSNYIPERLLFYRGQLQPMFLWFGISSLHWLASWMSMRNIRSHTATYEQAGLIIVFLLSRGIYDRLGFTFQSGGIVDYWQMIDPLLLQTDLWRSVLHLHSQPPMMNLFTGLVLQTFPSTYDGAFHLFHLLAGLVLAWSVYRLGTESGLPSGLSLAASVLFTVSPPAVLYEHWLFYTHPVAAALTLAGVSLGRFQSTRKFGWGFLFFSLLAFISLSWSLFHLIWLIAIASMIFFLHPYRKTVMLAALLPLALVVGWYAKNSLLFGEFTASTWAGMNLSHMTTLRLPDQERLQMVETGELSPFARYSTFSPPGDYLRLLPDTPETSVPLLDNLTKSTGRTNFHHLVYVEASNHYRQDAVRVIVTRPALYLRSITQSLYIFFHSASDYAFLDSNRRHIPALETAWNRLFFGQWQANEPLEQRTTDLSVRHVGWWIVIAFLTSLIGTIGHLWTQRAALDETKNLVLLFMGSNVLYLTLAGNSFDLGENNRFRFVVDAFIMILFLFVSMNVVRTIRSKITAVCE